MPIRTAAARWEGSLQEGSGSMRLGSGAYEGPYTFRSRFEDGAGTNPEELLGAAHAGCFSMALSLALSQAGHEPESVATDAVVHLDKDDAGFTIKRIELSTRGRVPGVSAEEFRQHAEATKEGCIISRALAVPQVDLVAELVD